MIDTHCHLNFHRFENDVDDVIKDSLNAGLRAIVNVGTSLESSQQAIDLAEKYPHLYAVVGIHPHHADKVTDNWVEELSKLADHPKVIAIGEIGMDYFSYQSNGIVDPKVQEEVFRAQIELSIAKKLPLQIHNRQAGKDVIRILKEYKSKFQDPPGMFHCFAGDFEVLQNVLDLGFFIGFDGNSTYPGFAPGEIVMLSDIAKQTPVERILVETDSPYLTPIPLRGQRNVPKNAIITARFLADLKEIPYETFDDQVMENFQEVFKVNLSDIEV